MKSIKEKSNEYAREYLFNPAPQKAPNEHFEAGANYVLEEVENFIKDLDLGNSSVEKFYKLDVLADIHGLIEQLRK